MNTTTTSSKNLSKSRAKAPYLSFIRSAFILSAACGPSAPSIPPPPEKEDPLETPAATITGRVWAPGQALGQAMPGQEIPVAGALIYVSKTRPDAIPDGVYCETCVEQTGVGAVTYVDGSFELRVPTGPIWLVVQKGQFRLETEINLAKDENIELDPSMTTLPSVYEPENGKYIPRIALVGGGSDPIETILGKMGMGTTSASGSFVGTNGTFDDYAGASGTTPGGTEVGNISQLMNNIDIMKK